MLSSSLEKQKTIATFTLTQKPSHFSWEFWKMSWPVNTALHAYMFPSGYSAIWFFFRLEIPTDKKPKIAPFSLTLGWLRSLSQILSFSYWREMNLFSQEIPNAIHWKKSLVLSFRKGLNSRMYVGCIKNLEISRSTFDLLRNSYGVRKGCVLEVGDLEVLWSDS